MGLLGDFIGLPCEVTLVQPAAQQSLVCLSEGQATTTSDSPARWLSSSLQHSSDRLISQKVKQLHLLGDNSIWILWQVALVPACSNQSCHWGGGWSGRLSCLLKCNDSLSGFSHLGAARKAFTQEQVQIGRAVILNISRQLGDICCSARASGTARVSLLQREPAAALCHTGAWRLSAGSSGGESFDCVRIGAVLEFRFTALWQNQR